MHGDDRPKEEKEQDEEQIVGEMLDNMYENELANLFDEERSDNINYKSQRCHTHHLQATPVIPSISHLEKPK